MGLSVTNLAVLRAFEPSSILGESLEFFEMLKYDTDNLRNEHIIEKDLLVALFQERMKSSKVKKKSDATKNKIKKQLNKFTKKLRNVNVLIDENDVLLDVKWSKIEEICDLLRLIERSDERQIRWAIYYLFSSGKRTISLDEIKKQLNDFKIQNLEKTLKKVIKEEIKSGFDAKYDNSELTINHTDKKYIGHHLADAIEEMYRRSPGELEEDILKLIDDGSYSNSEISRLLTIDEGTVSRIMKKLRTKNKIVHSSFGDIGMRYHTTNCDNCPFGKTKTSCRKDAIEYIVNTTEESFGINIPAKKLDLVETNQALLKIKGILALALKEKNTKLERNMAENLEIYLSIIVQKFLTKEVKINSDFHKSMTKLPLLYRLGLARGAKEGTDIVNDVVDEASKYLKKQDIIKLKKHSMVKTTNLGNSFKVEF